MTARILQGDCREILPTLADNSVHSVVTDPPYALVFMGQKWDNGAVAFDPAFWTDVLRVLKPGGYVLAFGGTRTYHRLACAIEDGGFEIRDQIGWLYGSGFPKSHNQSGDWKGWGTALKPAWESIVMARKALTGTVSANLAEWGTGAIHIDDCRIGTEESTARPGTLSSGGFLNVQPGGCKRQSETHSLGRWPANIIHDGSDEVLAAFPDVKGGVSTGRKGVQGIYKDGIGAAPQVPSYNDSGSAARFFYCAKASRSDRNDGCEAFTEQPLNWSSGDQSPGTFQAEGTHKAAKNNHPTVKPTELMRYLCRLVTPPGGTVLDLFMGSGSTGRGAVLEGFNFIGIEQDAHYTAIARARVDAASLSPKQMPLFETEAA